MKKLLFITPQNPELVNAGDKKYSWDILKALKYKNDIYIHVVSFFEESEKEFHYDKLEKLVDRVTYVQFKRMKPFQMTMSMYPAMIAHRKSKLMEKTVEDILQQEDYDAIAVNMFKMAYLISTLRPYSGKKIYISHNVESQVSKSIMNHTNSVFNKVAYFFDYLKTLFWENRLARHYDAVTTICDFDAELLKSKKKLDSVFVVRPVVDITPFNKLNSHSNKLIICGTFTWLPKIINIKNVLQCKSIKLLKEFDKYLLIVGNAEESVINEGKGVNNVMVSGYVESVTPYYREAEVALIPEQSGGGFKLKIAEAAKYHLPIVAIKGSVTDRQMEVGKHYIEAENFDDLILKGIQLCDDRKRQKELVENASALFSEYYAIETIYNELDRVMFYDK